MKPCRADRQPPTQQENPSREVVDYYTRAGTDYSFWTGRHNLHFGYYRWGMNPFDLEGMLEEMNRVVVEPLVRDPPAGSRMLDLGCGLGRTARWAAAAFPSVQVDGVTVVPWQAARAIALTREEATALPVRFVVGDFTRIPFPEETYDGVYALESSCYAPGLDKLPLLVEIRRVLKAGGRFAVADAFLKTTRPMLPWVRRCYRSLCGCWALQTLGEVHHFRRRIEELGFEDVDVRNISKQVTPSVLHIPRTALRFVLRELLFARTEMDRRRWGHFLAGFLLIAFTLDRSRSGYFLVSAAKPCRPGRSPGLGGSASEPGEAP